MEVVTGRPYHSAKPGSISLHQGSTVWPISIQLAAQFNISIMISLNMTNELVQIYEPTIPFHKLAKVFFAMLDNQEIGRV